MASNDSMIKTLTIATLLCVVCSVVVSTAAVLLKPQQIANKEDNFKRNILAAADLLKTDVAIDEQFKSVAIKLVDLQTGKFSNELDVAKYDQRKASKDPSLSEALDGAVDIAKINRLEKYAEIYVVSKADGGSVLVLPVRGYGLWSTLYGFLAVEGDMNTVVGLGFYEHGETPGLGGEVDNPRWKAFWPGKKLFNDDGSVAIEIIKGNVDPSAAGAEHKVDGLSGATLTSKGVHNLLQFWLGNNGYGAFLANMRKGEA